MNKKTKIICTMGPSTDDEDIIRELVENGMNVARLNFSHGTHESHESTINMLKKVRSELGVPLPILLDTKGPEYRIGTFKDGKIELSEGDPFTFCCEGCEGDETRVSVSYGKLCEELSVGDTILVNDGLVSFRVDSIENSNINCTTLIGGKLSDRKSMSFPGRVLKQEYLSAQDKEDLLLGIKNDVDFVACSFVSTAEDVKKIRNYLDANGGDDIQLIAKIENRSGIEHAEEILDVCEGLMVARGDLGVEIPYQELPAIQKKLIHLCNRKGAICITATEMLESMIDKPRPTRAEISDVANAVFDGSSAIMLSGETASGKYPVLAVKAMTSIALDAEKHINYEKRFSLANYDLSNLTDALSHAAAQLAIDTKAGCIVCNTSKGKTARLISRCRISMPILGITNMEKCYRQMDLCWNVFPVIRPFNPDVEKLLEKSIKCAELTGLAQKGQVVVVTGGFVSHTGGTKLIQADIVS